MDKFKVLEIKKSVFSGNEKRADELRKQLKEKKIPIKLHVFSGSRKNYNPYRNH